MLILKIALKLVYWVNTILLLISLLAVHINPVTFWLPAFIALFFKMFMLVHIILLIAFLILKKWRPILGATVLLVIAFPAISRNFGLQLSPKKAEGSTLRIATYNIMGISNGAKKDSAIAAKLVAHLLSLNPDVLCMQELSYFRGKETTIKRLINEGGYKYYYTSFGVRKGNMNIRGGEGQAILSRYPLFNFRKVLVVKGTSNGAIGMNMLYKGDTLSLINVHFQSIGLVKTDYTAPTSQNIDHYEGTISKLRKAFIRRGEQVVHVKAAADSAKYPLIICGDFNDTPQSFTYYTMAKDRKDSYLQANFGMGSTYGGPLPYLRIDFILVPNSFGIQNSRVMHWPESDHYALVSDVVVK